MQHIDATVLKPGVGLIWKASSRIFLCLLDAGVTVAAGEVLTKQGKYSPLPLLCRCLPEERKAQYGKLGVA
ncbi:hypothetical protein EJB05_47567 [Eragrostis curvula]|uniref:Uncharacterized protein n=1 Tax=Eragrostis curvula TaxID=38414 RepID=A0A5J9SZQ2_9POAL|nr:hypothetical protein EJB05_47567 [Eragrostis curvula]